MGTVHQLLIMEIIMHLTINDANKSIARYCVMRKYNLYLSIPKPSSIEKRFDNTENVTFQLCS